MQPKAAKKPIRRDILECQSISAAEGHLNIPGHLIVISEFFQSIPYTLEIKMMWLLSPAL